MIAENISLGILSLPAVIAKVGLIGGLIAIVGLGIFTTYSGYLLWQFRMRYPQVRSSPPRLANQLLIPQSVHQHG